MSKPGRGDTLVAVSTPPGPGGVGVIRLSGPLALSVARRIFKPRKPGADFPERVAVLGDILGKGRRTFLDEGFLLYFKAPHSYTREDVAEISLHGSPALLQEAVRLACRAGARRARPGEFTLRAYLNGRIDLLQAEAVDDIVRAVSLVQAEPALRLLRGGLSRKAGDIRDAVISLLADIEAGIEFPDENLRIPARRIRRGLDELLTGVERLCASYETGKALREGVTLAIVGRTNVGKSTLFNALLGQSRAIVHPKAGTTRDFLRETMNIGGALFHLIDMAGLGRPASAVETEGMRRGRQAAEEADGILFVFDSSARETKGDLALAGAWQGKKAVLVFNKSDLPLRIGEADVRSRRTRDPAMRISARSGAGIPDLRRLLRKHFAPVIRGSGDILLRARHRTEMESARQALRQARRSLDEGLPLELLAEELRQALPPLARLTGEVRSNDVLEAVFARFCVGK